MSVWDWDDTADGIAERIAREATETMGGEWIARDGYGEITTEHAGWIVEIGTDRGATMILLRHDTADGQCEVCDRGAGAMVDYAETLAATIGAAAAMRGMAGRIH